jgi:predicted phosphodiesterase
MEKEHILKFGLLSDLHYSREDPTENRYFRNSIVKLNKSIDEFNSSQLSFIVQLGDIINCGAESYETILPIFSRSSHKVYHVIGNHDFDVDESLISRVRNKFGFDANAYYSFSLNSFRFIFLDGNEISVYANTPKTANYATAEQWLAKYSEQNRPNAHFWNGGISQNQLCWLKAQLEAATEKKEYVIIFCHFPVYPLNKYNLLNYDEVIQLIANYNCVMAYISGHNHHGSYKKKGRCHFLNVKGMVETENETAFAIVSVYSDRLEVEGFGREESRLLVLNNN